MKIKATATTQIVFLGNALEADKAMSFHKHFQEGKSGPISSWGTEVGKEVRNMDKEQG